MIKLLINEQNYLTRTMSTKKRGVVCLRNWWLGHEGFNLRIHSLPKRYWGKHIRIKIEIVDEEELVKSQKKERKEKDEIIYQSLIG